MSQRWRRAAAVPPACGLVIILWATRGLFAAPDAAFVLGSQGCPMAHCDPRMSDLVNLPAPAGQVGIAWRSDLGRRSSSGLGCSSNGTTVACTFRDAAGDNLVVYDYDGNRSWTSGGLLNDTAWTSAPMVAVDGSVVAADSVRLVRFDPSGGVVWNTPTPGGYPTSPVLIGPRHVIMASIAGPVSAYDLATGALVARLTLRLDTTGATYSTTNTVCVRGNRTYVVAEKDGTNPDYEGRLVAVDAGPSGLVVAWQVPFGARSGTSPLAVGDTIYFAADRPAPGASSPKMPTIFAVRDRGDHGEVVWTHTVTPALSVLAALAQDPRGGVWFFPAGDEHLIRLAAADGSEIGRIAVDALVADAGFQVPGSAMTIAGPTDRPVMLVCAKAFPGRSFAVAVDLATQSLLWKVLISEQSDVRRGSTSGQFPVVVRNGSPRVVFSTWDLGVFGVGETAAP